MESVFAPLTRKENVGMGGTFLQGGDGFGCNIFSVPFFVIFQSSFGPSFILLLRTSQQY